MYVIFDLSFLENFKDCCSDDPKFRTTVSIPASGKGQDRVARKRCARCNCEELLKEDPAGDLVKLACNSNRGNARERCCKTCSMMGFSPPD